MSVLDVMKSVSKMVVQVKKTIRAMLILFPLLGITNLLFFINPKSLKKKEHEFLYMVVNSVLKSSQVSSVIFSIIQHYSPGDLSLISLLLFQHGGSGVSQEIPQKISTAQSLLHQQYEVK